MRVTQLQTYRNYLANVETLNESLNDANSQVSSGKKLTNLKDSPASSAQLVAINEQASEIDQYQSNIDAGSYYLTSADSILSEVNNLAATIYTKGSEAASDSVTADDRSAIATEVSSLRDQLVSLANSQISGRYIFGGSQTSVAPFAPAGSSIQYQGNNTVNKISVDDGLQVEEGVSGAAAFNSIFSFVDSLLSNLSQNNLTGIKSTLGQFETALSGLSLARGAIGANLSALNNINTNLTSRETNLTKQKSLLEDANMSESVVKLSQVKTALDTAIAASGSVLKQSNLFDILG
jgi:flagellar hook-associated protein 3 FlgL